MKIQSDVVTVFPYVENHLLVIGAIKEHVEDLEDGYLDGNKLAELIAKKIMEYRVNDDGTPYTINC